MLLFRTLSNDVFASTLFSLLIVSGEDEAAASIDVYTGDDEKIVGLN
jgi:hypothetical protein